MVNGEASTFLSAVLAGQQPPLPPVIIIITTVGCLPGQQPATYNAASFAALETSQLHLTAPQTATVVNNHPRCPGPRRPGPTRSRAAACPAPPALPDHDHQHRPRRRRLDLVTAHPVTVLGAPVAHVTVTLNGTDAELAARLWDVDPATGKQALITRGICRLTTPAPGSTRRLAFELWPTAWALGVGHQLKLELIPDDAPTWRPDNLPSTMKLTPCH